MKNIVLLTDYKNRFNLKHDDVPYRSGMDINLIVEFFNKKGFSVKVIQFSELDFKNQDYKGQLIVYTSQEDNHGLYKSYIDDILYTLEIQGAILIPGYSYFKAHHNKVFMEIFLEKLAIDNSISKLDSKYFGTLEELHRISNQISFPVVIKGASGANSKNVSLAKNKKDLFKKVQKLSYSSTILERFREFVRKYKYKGYEKESKYRKKFILQQFVPNLKNDWKILLEN